MATSKNSTEVLIGGKGKKIKMDKVKTKEL